MSRVNAKDALQRAQQLVAQGRIRQASKITAQLADAFPQSPQVMLMHASTLQHRGLHQDAMTILSAIKDALPQDSEHIPMIIVAIAKSHAMVGDLNASLKVLVDAPCSEHPAIVSAIVDRHLDLDQDQDAQKIFDHIGIEDELPIDTHPLIACAWSRLKNKSLSMQSVIDQLTPIANAGRPSQTLLFELGRHLESESQYDLAFEMFERANAINPPMYPREKSIERMNHIVSSFTLQSLTQLTRPSRDPNLPRPILIVGMPRSGTSLVEQILANHPQIAGAGESQALPELVSSLVSQRINPNTITQTLTQARSTYLAELSTAAQLTPNDAPSFITDKNPMNLFCLGHAMGIEPDLIIVRVNRDLRDVCFSCYTSPLSPDHNYKFDLASCAHFASTAHRVLDHIATIARADSRATWIDIEYEALTRDPTATISNLLQSLGLDPHPNCFNFHNSDRAVQTISRDQVRQPIHTRSVARWEHFAHFPQVQSMLAELKNEGLID